MKLKHGFSLFFLVFFFFVLESMLRYTVFPLSLSLETVLQNDAVSLVIICTVCIGLVFYKLLTLLSMLSLRLFKELYGNVFFNNKGDSYIFL